MIRSLIVFAALATAAPAVAQDEPDPEAEATEATEAEEGADLAGQCAAMKERHGEMRARMQEMQERLDGLLAEAREASRKEKPDATLAVVEELVAQQRQMHRMHHRAQMGMMRHMIAHGEACPMMQMEGPRQGAHGPGHHGGARPGGG